MESVTIRGEYRKLADDLPALVAEFGGVLGAREHADIATFAAAIERVDRVLDATVDRAARVDLAAAVVAMLDGTARSTGNAATDARLIALRAALVRRDTVARFVELARDTLATTERLRGARRVGAYLDAIESEGRLMVEMTLVILEPLVPSDFVAFLRATAELGNLADKLVDARGDYRRGEIAVRPGIVAHARIVARMLRYLPRAAALHPSRLRFVAWSAGWLAAIT
jgi:hypothetical protein